MSKKKRPICSFLLHSLGKRHEGIWLEKERETEKHLFSLDLSFFFVESFALVSVYHQPFFYCHSSSSLSFSWAASPFSLSSLSVWTPYRSSVVTSAFSASSSSYLFSHPFSLHDKRPPAFSLFTALNTLTSSPSFFLAQLLSRLYLPTPFPFVVRLLSLHSTVFFLYVLSISLRSLHSSSLPSFLLSSLRRQASTLHSFVVPAPRSSRSFLFFFLSPLSFVDLLFSSLSSRCYRHPLFARNCRT